MRIVLGGTFDPLHKGHKALFEKAFELAKNAKVIIGLTSDEMAKDSRTRLVLPYDKRKKTLDEYISTFLKRYPNTTYEIIKINEVFNQAITEEIDADALVVSEERKHIADETNDYRKRLGKQPLEIVVVKYILADDGLPIKATRIRKGEIDTEGRLSSIVRIAVGTENEVKSNAVKNIFQKWYKDIEIKTTSVSSDVSPQPWDHETIIGAINRSKAALKAEPDAHFGIGIEAGLFWNDTVKEYFDVQFCAICDRGGRITIGHGPGFFYPEMIIKEVKDGKTIGSVMSQLSNIPEIGKQFGAIGFLSNNILNREGLTEQAVIMALVPRITELYKLN
jgi:inosine/xanthosine triphosphatase